MRILHVTDFHIDSPSGVLENLREGFFEEFIDGLFNEVRNSGIGNVDLIVSTGDFVHKGKTENYSHAEKVLDYIVQKTGLGNSGVAITIGNHDFKLMEDGTREEKVKPFEAFSGKYIPGTHLGSTERCNLYRHTTNNCQVLIIDNSSREDTVNRPADISVNEQDSIVKLVREHLDGTKLVVISHYPMVLFPLAKYAIEDQSWATEHVWKPGISIQDRLSQLRKTNKTMFFCGDGHIPDAFQTDNSVFIMTGMLGGIYTDREVDGKPFHLETQVRIYDITDEPILWTFNYKPIGFDFDVTAGRWVSEKSNLRTVTDKKTPVQTQTVPSRTSVLSEPLEAEIITRIKREKLYKFGRYVTSPDQAALSWISINRLFEEQQLLINLIDKAIDWLSRIINDESKALLIGIDFYGAIISSHIGLRMGISNRCLASRSRTEGDLQRAVDAGRIPFDRKDISDIIIVTDVISSGRSVLRTLDLLEAAFEEQFGAKYVGNYHSISVISDQTISREEFDDRMKSIKTACASLRMPVIGNSELPSKDILSSRVDFTS